MGVGGEKDCPFHVTTLPAVSTRTQKAVVAHETEFSCPAGSSSLGWDQLSAVPHRGASLGRHAELRRHARDLIGGTPGADVARPARTVVEERVALAVDGDAERRPGAVDGGEALRTGDRGRSRPGRSVKGGDLVQARRGRAVRHARTREVGGSPAERVTARAGRARSPCRTRGGRSGPRRRTRHACERGRA